MVTVLWADAYMEAKTLQPDVKVRHSPSIVTGVSMGSGLTISFLMRSWSICWMRRAVCSEQ